MLSERDPFYLIERYLVTAPVIEASCAGRLMTGHVLGDLQLAAVLEVGVIPVARKLWALILVFKPAALARF